MDQFTIRTIGKIQIDDSGIRLMLKPEYIPALTELEQFSHINVFWWFDRCDTPASRASLVEQAPYNDGPATLGTFATRSPARPNPLALSCCAVRYVDSANGIIGLAYIDADDGSPVLDIKPYTPSLDRVEHPLVPAWCAHWPNSVEQSAEFDWSSVFTR